MSLKQWWRNVRPYVLSSLIYGLARTLGRTIRLEVQGFEKVKDLPHGKIYAGWHGVTLIPANFLKGRGAWVIISHSRDGEMQSRIFSKFGFQIIRGSTGRGGERALVESIRVLRKGGEMAMTPDGPRGPSGVVQPGVVMMARKSGAALIPVGISAKPAWRAPTWDRYLVPYPFAKGIFAFGEPIYLSENADEEEQERVRLQLEEAIHAMQTDVERQLGV